MNEPMLDASQWLEELRFRERTTETKDGWSRQIAGERSLAEIDHVFGVDDGSAMDLVSQMAKLIREMAHRLEAAECMCPLKARAADPDQQP